MTNDQYAPSGAFDPQARGAVPNAWTPPSCPAGHGNPPGATFCNICGSRLAPMPVAFQPPGAPAGFPGYPMAMPEAPTPAPVAARKPRWPVIVPIAVVLVILLSVGGSFAYTTITARNRDAAWQAAVNAVTSELGVAVDDERTISFSSKGKRECDISSYWTVDRWLGITTDYTALGICRAAAEAEFATGLVETLASVTKFADEVGIPASFTSRLEKMRGLDGTQDTTFEDTLAGPLQATYRYDGSNGLFVQIERVK